MNIIENKFINLKAYVVILLSSKFQLWISSHSSDMATNRKYNINTAATVVETYLMKILQSRQTQSY